MSNEVVKLMEKATIEDKKRIERLLKISLDQNLIEFTIKNIILDTLAKKIYDDELNIIFDKSSSAKEEQAKIASRIGINLDQLQLVADYKKRENVKCTLNKKENQGNTNDLDEPMSKMSIDEMNTVLNMKVAEKKDPEILESIAKRLGVPVDKLEEIASKKEEILKAKENDVTSSSDNSSSNENEDKDNDKEKSETTPSSDSSSSDAAETGAEAIEPEECKKTTALKTAGEKLKNAIAKNKGKALAGLLAIAGIAALALVNPTMLLYALGAAGLGKIYKDFQAGAKGK